LVNGPFEDLGELPAIERFVRTVVLHDEIVMEGALLPFDPVAEEELSEEERIYPRSVIVALRPSLDGYDFFKNDLGPRSEPGPEIDLSPALLETAARFANADDGAYYRAHVDQLKRLLNVVEQGGSVLLCGEYGQEVVATAGRYPGELFRELDNNWQSYACDVERDGLGFLVPPVLGIVLTRCARRDAIPAVIRDLRDEWSDARKKVWNMLAALRKSRTLHEALKIRKELGVASRLFSPEAAEADTQPVRALWEILASASAGAAIAKLSGGKPAIGAATGAVNQIARSLPVLAHDFGPILFGRGALDLAKKVRRETARIELDALPSLLGDAENQKLGLR
jgi:hypothetical protein